MSPKSYLMCKDRSLLRRILAFRILDHYRGGTYLNLGITLDRCTIAYIFKCVVIRMKDESH